MIIPIRCFTCNNVIAGKWLRYQEILADLKKGSKDSTYLSATQEKTAEGKAMDAVKLTRICCRRHFLTHVDII